MVAVGTTVVRSLETAAAAVSGPGRTRALVPLPRIDAHVHQARLQFRAVDAIVTNFHLPESTLLMLCAAFVGTGSAASGLCARGGGALSFFQLRRCHVPDARGRRPRGTMSAAARMRFEVLAHGRRARAAGRLDFARGSVETPAFMPVGTYGTVKAMTPEQLEAVGRRDRSRQYLPSVPAARARGHRGSRGTAPLHALASGRSSPTRAASRCGVSRRCARSARRARASARPSTARRYFCRPRNRCASSACSAPISR